MDKKIAIIGASGHGKVVADIAKLNGYEDIVFLDDDTNKSSCGKYKVIGTSNDISRLIEQDFEIFVGIGDNHIRSSIHEEIVKHNAKIPTLVHPSAVLDETVELGCGTVVMANVVINSSTMIGCACIVNTASTIDHDCIIHDYVHISPGVHIAGTVEVGSHTWLGIGSIHIQNVTIGSGCMIGAGGVVTIDVPDGVMAAGCPAVVKKK